MPLADRNNHEALNRRDWEVAFMNFDADVRFRIASGRENWAPDMDEEYRGPDGMQRAMEQFDEAWHEWQLDTGELIDLGERHVCLCRYHATGRSSGARVDHPVAHVITIRDRRIVAMDFYWDQSEALEAVGLADGGA